MSVVAGVGEDYGRETRCYNEKYNTDEPHQSPTHPGNVTDSVRPTGSFLLAGKFDLPGLHGLRGAQLGRDQ